MADLAECVEAKRALLRAAGEEKPREEFEESIKILARGPWPEQVDGLRNLLATALEDARSDSGAVRQRFRGSSVDYTLAFRASPVRRRSAAPGHGN
jgi:hypothetical protein